jgi:hypothetical protein
MSTKLTPDITSNVVRTWQGKSTFTRLWSGLNIHHRDAKRILNHKVWNSKKICYDGDSFVSVWIEEYWNSDEGKHFLLQLEDLKNGETRVTPMCEVEFVKHSHREGHKNYIVFKKK